MEIVLTCPYISCCVCVCLLWLNECRKYKHIQFQTQTCTELPQRPSRIHNFVFFGHPWMNTGLNMGSEVRNRRRKRLLGRTATLPLLYSLWLHSSISLHLALSPPPPRLLLQVLKAARMKGLRIRALIGGNEGLRVGSAISMAFGGLLVNMLIVAETWLTPLSSLIRRKRDNH